MAGSSQGHTAVQAGLSPPAAIDAGRGGAGHRSSGSLPIGTNPEHPVGLLPCLLVLPILRKHAGWGWKISPPFGNHEGARCAFVFVSGKRRQVHS